MQDTWIKLYRKLLVSPVFDNPAVLKVWLWALLKANHRETAIVIGYQAITLNPGEFIYGRFTAAEELHMTPSSVRNCLSMLSKLGNLDIKSTNKFSIVSIKNWTAYQELGQQSKNKVKTNGQQIATDNNDKNVKNDKKRVGAFAPPTLDEVKAYCDERKNGVDAKRWHNFYSAKGWMVGKNKMQDWQAAVRTWEKDEKPNLVEIQKSERRKQIEEEHFKKYGAYPL